MDNLLQDDIIGSIGTAKYLCTIKWYNGEIIMDEPKEIEGGDKGPDPYSVLLASLAGCTLSTLRMYIDRKGWNIPEVIVRLNMSQEKVPSLKTSISRTISFPTEVPQDQKERLLIIATKCPISKLLENQVEISNTI